LFNECPKLEDARLINTHAALSQIDWLDVLTVKFEDSNLQPLKRLELKLGSSNEEAKNEIRNLFRKRWHKSLVKIVYFSLNIIELIVD
jgi:hypothetical protein